jgi:hypothetical protein
MTTILELGAAGSCRHRIAADGTALILGCRLTPLITESSPHTRAVITTTEVSA